MTQGYDLIRVRDILGVRPMQDERLTVARYLEVAIGLFFDLAENEPMLNRRSNVSRLTPTLLLSQAASPKLTIVRNGGKRGVAKYG